VVFFNMCEYKIYPSFKYSIFLQYWSYIHGLGDPRSLISLFTFLIPQRFFILSMITIDLVVFKKRLKMSFCWWTKYSGPPKWLRHGPKTVGHPSDSDMDQKQWAIRITQKKLHNTYSWLRLWNIGLRIFTLLKFIFFPSLCWEKGDNEWIGNVKLKCSVMFKSLTVKV
jgi:hypothetical protein